MSNKDQLSQRARMVNDGAMIFDEARWPPSGVLQVKTQTWWQAPQEFGFIERHNKTTVINKDPKALNDHFDSISALVEKWSVV